MTPGYYKIVRTHSSLQDLENAVAAASDYEPLGAPFRDPEAREWCQAMTRRPVMIPGRSPVPDGEIRLREPKRKR